MQPLIDGIIKYLPSPSEVKPALVIDKEKDEESFLAPNSKGKLCALAFKVVNDKEKGLITFFRVYSGMIKNR